MTADASSNSNPGEPHTLTVQLGDDAGLLKIALPPGQMPPAAVLPALQSVADAIVARAIAVAEARGQAISCGAGCAACCRHLALISDVEAQALADLVARLPAARQAHVRARFASARERLIQAGLAAPAKAATGLPPERLKALARDYFRLEIACPFLDDQERCSIYEERPLVCRRMVVTSPAVFCAEPDGDRVEMVRVPMLAAATLLLTSEEDPPQPAAVPLALALDWAESERPVIPPRGADEWMRRFAHRLAETRG
ncbi:MAG TPA: YkgJ family cysteine cluster protein [Vineibacter sp.]|nr:YkgJ family cysteine cluster protein [Vineibacter sp.]